MQSHNGDVELSVTLSTKGVKSDVQRIKDEIYNQVKKNGLSLHPSISEKELEKVLKEINESSDNTIELTPEIDRNKMAKAEKLFKNVVDVVNNRADDWTSAMEGLRTYQDACIQLSYAESNLHKKWIDDNFKLVDSNEKVSDSIMSLSAKQLLAYSKKRKDLMLSESNMKEALAESQPLVSPKVDVSEDDMNQALVNSNPTVEPDVYIPEETMEQAILESNPVIIPKIEIKEDDMNQALVNSNPAISPKMEFNNEAVDEAVDNVLHNTLDNIVIGGEGGSPILSEENVVDVDAITAVEYLNDLLDRLLEKQHEMVGTDKQDGEEWNKIENTIDKTLVLRDKIAKEGSNAIPDFLNQALEDRYNRTQEALKQTQEELAKSIAPTEDAENAQREFDKLIEKIYGMDTALKDGKTTAQELAFDLQKFDEGFRYSDTFADIMKTFNSLKSQFDSVVSKMHEMEILGESDSDEYKKMAERASKLADAIGIVKDDMLTMRNYGSAYEVGGDPSEYAKVEKQYNALAQRLSLLRHEQEKTAESSQKTSKKFFNYAKTVQVLSNNIKHILGSGISKIPAVFKRLTNMLKGTNRQLNRFGMSFKQILGYTLGIQGIYSLFSKLRGAITIGVTNLAKWRDGNNRANESLSTLTSSLTYMKNAWGAAFEPILTFVTPVLNILIEKIAEVANAISYMMAKLTGQSTWMKAVRVQKDYAKSLSGTGGAAKEAEQRLADYDKLVMVNTNNAGGASSANADIDDMFEEMSMDDAVDWVDDFLAKIKQAWEKADFTGIGNIIGEWLKNALDSIPWKEVQDFVKKLAHSIATLLNGFFETEGLGTTIGKTIAEALKTAFMFVNEFVHTLHWDSIGRFIADALLAIFEDEELFKEAGEAIGGTIRGFIDLVWGALNEFTQNDGFEKIGQRIADFINSVLKELNAVDEKTGLTGWEKLGQSISMSVEGLLDVLSTALGKSDWKSLANGIVQVLENINWLKIIDKLNNVASNLLKAIAKAIEGVTDEGVKGALATAIALLITGLVISVDTVTLLILAADVILGFNLGKVIGDVITGGEDSQWYKDFSFTTLILDVFGVGDKDELEKELTTNLTHAIIEALSNVKGAVEQYLGDWSIGAIILKVLTFPTTLILAVYTAAINIIINFMDIVQYATMRGYELGTKIGEWLKEKISNIKDLAIDLWEGIKLYSDDIAFWITDLWESYIVPFNDNLTLFITSIPDNVKTMANDVISFVESLLNKIISGLNSLFSSVGSIDIEVPEWATKIGLGDLSFDVPSLRQISLPRLAQGAVIPPNKEFMAVLGDQKSGVNIETPLDTMVEAFKIAMEDFGGNNNQPIVLQLDGRTIAQAVWDEDRKKYKQTRSFNY